MKTPMCYKRNGIIFFQNNKIPKKWKVLKRLGVKKGTFAGDMISRMYDYYFFGAINLRKEYKKYYKKEFLSLDIYIQERFCIEREEAEWLAESNYSMKECSRRSIERNIETLNYDRDFKSAFSKVVGGLIDEDPDGIYYE